MANYRGTSRTNYFRVKDENSFKAWIATHAGATLIDTQIGSDIHYGVHMGASDSGTWPSTRECPETGESDCYFFAEFLAEHLQDGEVAILISVGSERMRYLGGEALAVHSSGEMTSISLNDIYEKAQAAFGTKPTAAEH